MGVRVSFDFKLPSVEVFVNAAAVFADQFHGAFEACFGERVRVKELEGVDLGVGTIGFFDRGNEAALVNW